MMNRSANSPCRKRDRSSLSSFLLGNPVGRRRRGHSSRARTRSMHLPDVSARQVERERRTGYLWLALLCGVVLCERGGQEESKERRETHVETKRMWTLISYNVPKPLTSSCARRVLLVQPECRPRWRMRSWLTREVFGSVAFRRCPNMEGRGLSKGVNVRSAPIRDRLL